MNDSFQGLWCTEVIPLPVTLVIFGAAGDLAYRKLYPALHCLWHNRLLHSDTRIIGCARRNWSDTDFRKYVSGALNSGMPEDFAGIFSFVSGDYAAPETYSMLKVKIAALETEQPAAVPRNQLFYMALPSQEYVKVIRHLSACGALYNSGQNSAWHHVLVEKPFGHDRTSAAALNRELTQYAGEDSIYRIDHYLAKDTVQNITMLRFANRIFEPVWNKECIESVDISVSETLGVENRGKYYDRAGCLRDMFQNHMLELMTLAAMEKPEDFTPDLIHNAKLKLINDIKKPDPLRDFFRGQYTAGNGMKAYRMEKDVSPDSMTETFAACRLFVNNARWDGVPFFLRAGKRLDCRKSEITIRFKAPDEPFFSRLIPSGAGGNELVLKIHPAEGLALRMLAKKPGPKLCMGEMTLGYGSVTGSRDYPDEYARLLLDAMLGDRTLFVRSDTIDGAWKLFDPVLDFWASGNAPLHFYPAGTQVSALTGTDSICS